MSQLVQTWPLYEIHTDFRDGRCGVPQGSNLGPPLFLHLLIKKELGSQTMFFARKADGKNTTATTFFSPRSQATCPVLTQIRKQRKKDGPLNFFHVTVPAQRPPKNVSWSVIRTSHSRQIERHIELLMPRGRGRRWISCLGTGWSKRAFPAAAAVHELIIRQCLISLERQTWRILVV